jgi:hypothetical protein
MNWRGGLARIDRASPRRLRVTIGLTVTIVMLGMISHGNYAGSGDAVHYMVIARSLAFDRDLDVANDYADPHAIIKVPAGNHARIGRGGVLRPVHDIGLPALAAPYFAVAYRLAEMTDRLPSSLRRRARIDAFIALRQLVSLFMILVTAALAIAFFHASWAATGEKALAFCWAIIWTLSPPILTHGYVFFTEVPSALLALIVFGKRNDLQRDHPVGRGLLLSGLLGLLILIHVRNIGLVLALAVMIVWRARANIQRASGFAAGLAIMALVKIALNERFWGTALTTPHEHPGGWPGIGAFLSEVAVRGFGLVFDVRHGLLLSAPIYLLAAAAWLLLRRRSKSESMELLWLIGAYLAFILMPITNVHGWRGGWSPAARFLVPVAPFLALGVPLLLLKRGGQWVAIAIICLQLAFDAFFWGHPMLLWSEWPGPAPLADALIGSSLVAMLPVWEHLTATLFVGAVAAIAIWIALSWALVRPAAGTAPPRGA